MATGITILIQMQIGHDPLVFRLMEPGSVRANSPNTESSFGTSLPKDLARIATVEGAGADPDPRQMLRRLSMTPCGHKGSFQTDPLFRPHILYTSVYSVLP